MGKYLTLNAFLAFITYLGLGIALLLAFTRLYMWTTPYNEINDIRVGKKAPAVALVGAMFGVTLPLLSMSYHGVNVVDFLVWSVVAMGIQLLCFKILYWLIPAQIEADNQAVGILFAGAAISVGAIGSEERR